MRARERLMPILTAPTVIAVVILTALWALFFWRLLTPTHQDRVIFAKGDFPLHYFSYSDFQAERMWDGQIPLWNPYNYGGDPFAANVQWAVWYPPRWITMLLAGPDGWGIEALQLEVAAHYWLVSLMMFAFLRILIQRPIPALLGSILWTYGGYLTGYPMLQPSILEAIAWLPLLMLGAHLSVTRPQWRVRGILLGGAMIGLSFFGGHTQTTMQMTYFAAAYIAFLGWQRRLRWTQIAGRIALLGLTGAALAAVQLLPALELTRRSYRTEDYFYAQKSVGYTLTEFAQFLWPRLFQAEYWPLYLGVAGLLLALGAILRPSRERAFWIGAMVVALCLSLGGNSVVYDIFYNLVPGFNVFREQERAASLAVFSMVVLAAQQIDWLLAPRAQPAPAQRAVSPDALPAVASPSCAGNNAALTPVAISDPPSPAVWERVSGGEGGLAVADVRPTHERRFLWLARGHLLLATLIYFVFVGLVIARHEQGTQDLESHTMGLIAFLSLFFSAWLMWRQRGPHPLLPAALLLLIVVDLFTFGMKSPNFVADNEFNRIRPPDHLDLLQQPVEDIHWHVDGAAGIQSYGTTWRIPDIYGTGPFRLATLEKLRQIRVDRRWEVFAVSYATMTAEVPENVPVEAIGTGVNYDGQEYTLYQLTDPRPFAHLVYTVRVADDQDAAREIMKEPWINLREIGVVTQPLRFDLPGARPSDAAVSAFKMVMPEYMEMSVTTSENALLTLPVANYPGWQATVNGERVQIVDTYAGLIGIPIQAGANQKVTLRFAPRSVIAGGIISAVALAAVAGYVVAVVVLNRRDQTANPASLEGLGTYARGHGAVE